MNLAERIDFMDRSSFDSRYIDPEELHFSQADNCPPELNLKTSSSSSSSSQSYQSPGTAVSSELNLPKNVDSASSVTSKNSFSHEQPEWRPKKAYAPRVTASERKSNKAALRVRPRNGQHARELERNRQAAANYRSRQKNQLDSLLTRVREEEDKMVKQKGMVYSLKEELWQLRNNMMARQQMQLFAMRNMEGIMPADQQSSSFDPVAGFNQQG